MQLYDQILDDWFGTDVAQIDTKKSLWFGKSEATDKWLTERYAGPIDEAMAGAYDSWMIMPRGCSALVILLDQFSRNIYRDTPRMYAQDARSLAIARKAIDAGLDRGMPDYPRCFLYMPFMHSESRVDQATCVALFQVLVQDADESNKAYMSNSLDYALKHWEIVDAFGRFPHRNAILGRQSTDEEVEFLKAPGSSF